jgi:glutathione S-transferase
MTVGQPSNIRRRLLAFNINALLGALLLLLLRPVVAFGTVGKISYRSSIPPTQQQRIASTSTASASVTRLEASLTIYGHPGSRSPLVNWACLELAVPFEMGDLDENPHPFGQMPCLTDGEAVIFESGAILQYLQQTYGQASPADAASILSWIVWANASFDPICFLETPTGKVYDTALRQPNKKVKQLNDLLEQTDWLVGSGDTFTVADVAIASYGLYVLLFFPDVSIAKHWPALAKYLLRAVQRPNYGKAFGANMQAQLANKLTSDLKQFVKK